MLAATPVAPLFAQSQTSVVNQAQDVFGQRVGNEEIGLYTETQVRGFSLENAGNYRLDGHYYVRAAKLPDIVLQGVTIEVGSSALATSFPAPSGIVSFKLRNPGAGRAGLAVEAGIRPQYAPILELEGWLANEDQSLSLTGGAFFNPRASFGDGTEGSEYAAGVIPRAKLGEVQLTGLASYLRREFNGNYRFRSTVSALPPELKGVKLFAPPWQRFNNALVNLGGMADWSSQSGWEGKVAVFWSDQDQPASDFATLAIDPDGRARTTAIAVRDQFTRSLSGEFQLARLFDLFGASHKLLGNTRYRRTTTRSSPGESFDIGTVDLNERDFGPPPVLRNSAIYSRGLVTQKSVGIGYELTVPDRFKIQAGVQRVLYDKTVAENVADMRRNEDRFWIYDASAIVPLSSSWIGFASYARGIEEKGVAPNIATNRNEVLPAVVAEQIELGVRGRVLGRLSVIAGLFKISKPTTGFDENGRFGLLGDVRHRGVEVSVSGKATDALTIATGALFLDPANSGPAVENGVVSQWPAGQSKVTAQINTDYRLPWLPSLSLDLQLTYNGQRPADVINSFRTKDTLLVDLGTRYRFPLAGKPTVMRFRVQNLLGETAWTSDSSGSLSRIRPRALTLTAETTF